MLVSFLFLFPDQAAAKSHSLDQIHIWAEILPDGSLRIEETRTYTFRGSFSWADYRLPLENPGTVTGFELAEEGQVYRESADESPGTYRISIGKEEMYVKWFCRARNETRKFTLRYLVADALVVYDDVAEFYYKFIGRESQKQAGAVNVIIKLPRPAVYDNVRAWAHGPLWGTILFKDGVLNMSVSPLPPKAFWEARVVFPPFWVPDARQRIGSYRLPKVLSEETVWANQANKERKRAREALFKREENERKGWHVAGVASAIGLLCVGSLLFKTRSGTRVPYYQEVDSTLPEYPPAIFSGLYFNKQVTGNTLVATLFDLARRGFITIEQKEPVEKKWWRIDRTLFLIKPDRDKWMSAAEELASYERSLLDFLFDDLGAGKEAVDFLDFRRHPIRVRKWFQSWKKLLDYELKSIPFWEKKSVTATIYGLIISAAVIAGGILTTFYLGRPGILAVIAGAFCLVLSLAILCYTPEMKLRKMKWKALRKYLTRYRFVDESSRSWLYQLPDYLIYAIAMGAGHKTVRKLMERVPADQQGYYFPWYIYSPGSHASIPDFASAISSMVSVASSTMSSSTGAGGGASGGGGGGAGGASGGAG